MSDGPHVITHATVDTTHLREAIAYAQATLITKGGLTTEEADARLREWADTLGDAGHEGT